MNQVMKLNQIARVKSNLLELVDVLERGDMTREEVACDLVANILTICEIERRMTKEYTQFGFMHLQGLASQKEDERTGQSTKQQS